MIYSSKSRSVFLGAIFLLALCGSAQATDKGMAQQFSWQNTQGSWLTSWGTIPDEKIIANRHTIKKSINDTVSPSLCGIGNTDYDSIKTYAVDFSGDGTSDYVLDEYAYFIKGEGANCPVRICEDINGDGTMACTIALFRNLGSPTQILTATDETVHATTTTTTSTTTTTTTSTSTTTAKACPKKAADNTTCRSDCAATPEQCPALFSYEMEVDMSRPVFDWTFSSVGAYVQFRLTRLNIYGEPMYHAPYNANPVFVATVGTAYCTTEELIGGACVKYYQYVTGSIGGKADTFVDLYDPMPKAGVAENDARATTIFYDRTNAKIGSLWRESTEGSTLPALSTLAFQVSSFVGKDGTTQNLLCREVTNTANTSYFVPPRTDIEIESFLKAITAGNLAGVTQQECTRKFTAWYGTTTCPAMACNETRVIAAERRCQRSSSAYGDCSECAAIVDTDLIEGYATNQCTFEKTCVGPVCPPHHSCFAADTEITMADGSRKPITAIKTGDRVMGFDRDAPLAPAKPAVVKDLMLTQERELLWVNATQVTPGHPFLMASGVMVPARAIKLGDKLVGSSGEEVLVSKIGPVTGTAKVYNFSLEGADGYIANGVRVMMFPDID